MRKAELALQGVGIDTPGQIGGLRHPALHRAGDTKGCVSRRVEISQKLAQQCCEGGVIAAGVIDLVRNSDLHAAGLDECQTRIGAADVTRKKMIHGCR